MDTFQHGFWYSERNVSFADRHDTRLPPKYPWHGISAQAPKLCHVSDTEVPLAVWQ